MMWLNLTSGYPCFSRLSQALFINITYAYITFIIMTHHKYLDYCFKQKNYICIPFLLIIAIGESWQFFIFLIPLCPAKTGFWKYIIIIAYLQFRRLNVKHLYVNLISNKIKCKISVIFNWNNISNTRLTRFLYLIKAYGIILAQTQMLIKNITHPTNILTNLVQKQCTDSYCGAIGFRSIEFVLTIWSNISSGSGYEHSYIGTAFLWDAVCCSAKTPLNYDDVCFSSWHCSTRRLRFNLRYFAGAIYVIKKKKNRSFWWYIFLVS